MIERIYSKLFIFLPLPLFFDIGTGALIILPAELSSWGIEPSIPVPVGSFALAIILILGYFQGARRSGSMTLVLSPNLLMAMCVVVYLPFFTYGTLGLGLGVPRVLQILMPLLMFSILAVPNNIRTQSSVIVSLIFGSALLIMAHAISVASTSESMLQPNHHTEFSGLFGLYIYQSLVSYVGVLTIYLLVFLVVYSEGIGRGRWGVLFSKSIAPLIVIAALYLLLVSGRKIVLIDLALLVIVYTGFLFLEMAKRGTLSLVATVGMIVLLCASMAIVSNLDEFSLFDRWEESFSGGQIQDGRRSAWARALEAFFANVPEFFIGFGGKGRPGFHNYFFDQVYRIGIVWSCLLFGLFAALIIRFFYVTKSHCRLNANGYRFFCALFGLFVTQSIINSSISQPYYFTNVLAAFLVGFLVLAVARRNQHRPG